jgi:hypothetical protein
MTKNRFIIATRYSEHNYGNDLWKYREMFYFLAWRNVLAKSQELHMHILSIKPEWKACKNLEFNVIKKRLKNLIIFDGHNFLETNGLNVFGLDVLRDWMGPCHVLVGV